MTSSTGPTGTSDTKHSLCFASVTFAVWRAAQNLFVQHLPLGSPKALKKTHGLQLGGSSGVVVGTRAWLVLVPLL